MTEKGKFHVRIDKDHIVALESDATFDGVAIADEIKTGISLILEKRDDPDFRGRVKMAYKKAREELKDLPYGQELIDALGDPLQDYYEKK